MSKQNEKVGIAKIEEVGVAKIEEIGGVARIARKLQI